MILALQELAATVRKERESRNRGGADDCYTDNARSATREHEAIERILAMIEAPGLDGLPTDMHSCEIDRLILNPNQLYRFSPAPGCEACAAYHDPQRRKAGR